MASRETTPHDDPPLNGVRVVELGGGIASALATRWLRGYGALATRLEPVDETRNVALTPNERTALLHGVIVERVASQLLLERLRNADIVVSDRRPKELVALGIDVAQLRVERPDLIIVSITPFGLTGPAANDESTNAVSFAAGGIMSLTGDPDRAPLLTGGEHAYALGAANAFAAATAAWFGRTIHGRGDLVDISMQECAAGMLEYYGPITSLMDAPGHPRLGNHTRASWGVFPCVDGWVGVFALERQIPALFALLNDPELEEPRFREPLQRYEPENDADLTAKLYVFFSQYTMAEVRELSIQSRVPFGTVLTLDDVLKGASPADRGFWDEVHGPQSQALKIPGRPFPGFVWKSATGASEGGERKTPTPTTTPNAAVKTTATTPLPLAGIRVIDLTMMWAGPFATLRLAEMGADVIKVESPSAWDNIRTLINQPGVADPWNSSVYFNAYSRDKRSLTLDLAQVAGREALFRLLPHCDVVIENYRADVLDNLGLGYDVLRQYKSDIVVVSMAAFGKSGADSAFVGFGPVIEMMSGLASLSGYGDGEPFKTGISYGDPVAGTFAAAAVMLGLTQRNATGRGLHVDLAQRETASVLVGEAFVASQLGEDLSHTGNRSRVFAPQGCYPANGDDRWVVISVRSDDEWRALCGVMGATELADLDDATRRARHDEIDDVLSAWMLARDPVEASALLQRVGVPAKPVLTTRDILEDEHLNARGYWHRTPHPKMPSYKQQGVAWRFADAPVGPRHHAPLFGQHNVDILRDLVGMTHEEIDALRLANVIADAPINPGIG